MGWQQASESVVFRSGWTTSPSVHVPRGYVPQTGTTTALHAHKSRTNKRSMSMITSRSIRKCDQLDGASDADSDGGSLSDAGTDTSLPSSLKHRPFSVSLVETPFSKTTLETSLGHEGWLAKLSSQNPRRWSRRYFVLKDGALRSFMAPRDVDSEPQSILHICSVRAIRAQDSSDSTCRVLELDVVDSSSPQQLRADTPEAMRRWLYVLEAACLVGSTHSSPSSTCCTARGSKCASEIAPGDSWETASASPSTPSGDKDPLAEQPSGVSLDTTTSDASLCESDGPRTLDSLEIPSANPVEVPLEIQEDFFQLDHEELKRQIAAWLDTSQWHAKSHEKRKGGEVLQVLWNALGGCLKDDGISPASAIAAVKKQRMEKGSVASLNAAIEAVTAEFLKQLRQSLSALLEDASVQASEVEDISSWWLLDARPAIEEFEQGVAEEGFRLVDWRPRANDLEHALLSEWEVRCCEELSAACETACFSTQKGQDDGLQLDAVLNPLRIAVRQIDHWNSRQAVRDRAVSVLIAAMNAALRALRRRCNRLVGSPQDSGSGGGDIEHFGGRSGSLPDIDHFRGRSGSGDTASFSGRASLWATALQRWALGKDAAMSSQASEISIVACSASAIANFCTGAEVAQNAACVDLMSTFSCAFEQLCEEACGALVGVLFVSSNRNKLRIQFRKRELRKAHSAPGGSPILLGPSIAAAEAFLSTLPGAPAFVEACMDHVVSGVVRALVRAWFLGLAQAPPVKLKSAGSSGLLCNAASLDAAALRSLQRRFKKTDQVSREDPVVALDILVETLRHESSLNLGRLRVAVQQFGVLLGRDVASAVELSLNAAFVI